MPDLPAALSLLHQPGPAGHSAREEIAIAWRDDPANLIGLLHAGPDHLRPLAADALGTLRDRAAFDPLVAALSNGDPALQGHAAQALVTVAQGHPDLAGQAAGHVAALLASPNPRLCWAAAEALNDLGPAAAPAVPALLEAWLQAQTSGLRQVLSQVLLACGSAAIPRLAKALYDPCPAIALQAEWALAHLALRYPEHAQQIESALLARLESQDG